MAKNNKGIEKKEYPKLIKVGDKKVRVTSPQEEAQYDNVQKAKDEKKPGGWGNQ